ncbi:hypothetical protein POVWA1_018320 [Plasmodium ovale wallikeri]|uniref:Uncharacterized protein n=1 Tax=Plasmodium ovale wallikeri TaxID=864142 RepID=A0A1A8YPW8_PLAOA|nr:hypothetical protein POVWA1_018320 [Plasmodium ovale wallikeri]
MRRSQFSLHYFVILYFQQGSCWLYLQKSTSHDMTSPRLASHQMTSLRVTWHLVPKKITYNLQQSLPPLCTPAKLPTIVGAP